MFKYSLTSLLVLLGALLSSQAFAVSFGFFDPRSMAMGGTGVASADGGSASFYNPAMLAAGKPEDDFNLVIPIVGIRFADPDGLEGALDSYQAANYESAASTSISTFNSTPTNDNALAAIGAIQNLQTGINTLSNKAVIFDSNVGAVLGIPNSNVGIAFFTNIRTLGGVQLNISDADNTTLTWYVEGIEYIRTLTLCNGDPATPCADRTAFIASGAIDNLTSTVDVRGAMIQESGVSLARQFRIFGLPVALGITPKSVTVTTFDYALGLQSASFDPDIGNKEYSDSNFDIGLVSYLGRGLRIGVVAKNIMEKTYLSALNNPVTIKTQYRAGVSHQTRWLTLALDMDLVSNEPLGFEEKTKYISAGVEFNLFNIAQVRLGKKQNQIATATSAEDITTFGLGLSPFGIHMDLAYAENDNDKAFALQLGFKF